MPKKKEKENKLALKPEKPDKLLHDEIDKIIKVTDAQNLAISKILKSNTKIIKTEVV